MSDKKAPITAEQTSRDLPAMRVKTSNKFTQRSHTNQIGNRNQSFRAQARFKLNQNIEKTRNDTRLNQIVDITLSSEPPVATDRGFLSPGRFRNNTTHTGMVTSPKIPTCDNSEDLNLHGISQHQETNFSSDKNHYQLENILDSRKLNSFKRQFIHAPYGPKIQTIKNNVFISLQNRAAFPDKIPESVNDDKVTVGASNQNLDTLGASQPNSVTKTDRWAERNGLQYTSRSPNEPVTPTINNPSILVSSRTITASRVNDSVS